MNEIIVKKDIVSSSAVEINIDPKAKDVVVINPKFENLKSPEFIKKHMDDLRTNSKPNDPQKILKDLLQQFEPIDFQALAYPEVKALNIRLSKITHDSDERNSILKELSKFKVGTRHQLVLSIENIRNVAHKNRWSLCKNQDFIYLYNGAYWTLVEEGVLKTFLGEAAERMGINPFSSRYYQFRDQLLKQFLATEYLPTPVSQDDKVLINLLNGTYEITSTVTKINQFSREDFMTYQLPFNFDESATAPIFQAYLDRVLPDKQRQLVLAEYMGYVFIRNGNHSIKEEKALVLYGGGANGKSVFFEVINALLGSENVSSFSLQNLTDTGGYSRAMIANKLVNYASELSGSLETAIFKQMTSGEPIEARLPYGNPMVIRQYAKLIFNSNELPREVEHSHAYFRRFLIIPFDVTIPEEEQDKQLHHKIISNELSGVFNWVLAGLNRLLEQKHFSQCDAAKNILEQYKKESDSVRGFLEENWYESSPSFSILLKDLYLEYRSHCSEGGYKSLNKTNFKKRLSSLGFSVERKNNGYVVFVVKINSSL